MKNSSLMTVKVQPIWVKVGLVFWVCLTGILIFFALQKDEVVVDDSRYQLTKQLLTRKNQELQEIKQELLFTSNRLDSIIALVDEIEVDTLYYERRITDFDTAGSSTVYRAFAERYPSPD